MAQFLVRSKVDFSNRPVEVLSDFTSRPEEEDFEEFIIILPDGYEPPSGFETNWFSRNWREKLAPIPGAMICWDGFVVPATIFPVSREDGDDLEWYLSRLNA